MLSSGAYGGAANEISDSEIDDCVEVVYSRASRSSMVAQARERRVAHLLSGRAPRSITLPGGV